MKRFYIVLPFLFLFILVACEKTKSQPSFDNQIFSEYEKQPKEFLSVKQQKVKNNSIVNIEIVIGNQVFLAKLNQNSTTQAFIKQMPFTVTMGELNGNEKFYYLPEDLPTNTNQVSGIKTGDLMLYGSDCIVLFYKDFATSYRYTSLGSIENTTGLLEAVGKGNVKVTFQRKAEGTKKKEHMKISVKGKKNTIVFQLNDSQAAKDFYAQLPLTTQVEDFSTNEKIFYPPNKLSTKETPLAEPKKGSLCYYSPWGDVVMFYQASGKGSNLYELGEVISGKENIKKLSGTIQITAED